MEAWILHVKEESINDKKELDSHDNYSAWSTDKQAIKAATAIIERLSHFNLPDALLQATKILIADHPLEAINLINTYSKAEILYLHGSNYTYRKYTIKITKSKFSGSAFE